MKSLKEVYIINGARTAFDTYRGGLKDVEDVDLGVAASMEAIKRSGLSPESVDQVVIGNVNQTTKNAIYLARHIALKSGIPIQTPALLVNRLCGSSIQAVISGTQSILSGESTVSLVGGTENLNQVGFLMKNARFGEGNPYLIDLLQSAVYDSHANIHMGNTAENLAKEYNISREEQDQFALLSHQRALHAKVSGRFTEEIVPMVIKTKKGEKIIGEDEHIRLDSSMEKLSKLRPVFDKDGTVTAGNACGNNGGACSLIIADTEAVKRENLKPKARIVSWGITGVEPTLMGIGPVSASELALRRANLQLKDIDLIEVNEAFAAQYLAVEKAMDLDRSKTNVNGGAIALGHPVGATGARLIYSMMLELEKRNRRYGLASMCIGGGQGIAIIIERV